jgi:hypothetical protein
VSSERAERPAGTTLDVLLDRSETDLAEASAAIDV